MTSDWTHCHDPSLRLTSERDADSYADVNGATPDTLAAGIEGARMLGRRRRGVFDDRIAKEGRVLERIVATSNRIAAVRTQFVGEVPHHHGQCACGWLGLLTVDRGLALQQHAEHACAMTGETTIDGAQLRAPSAKLAAQGLSVATDLAAEADATEQRMQLLELK